MSDQLSRTKTGGEFRVALRNWHMMQATGRGHFDHRSLVISQNSIEGLHSFTLWPHHFDFNKSSLCGVHQRLHRTFTTVRNRDSDKFCIMPYPSQPSLNRITHLLCR
ncbi:Uncharacterised protein [Vibrio cholerae]|uniref:Uncharacterized protein n=1 Tax=Vibrio cholerae TaxID=666 RepID=A0A655UNK2_VIBCL|nr:Uncharacterised protein [Vibrio cholerae]CSA36841.1 Uncharacterised protein [Vibrio cholerae]CSA80485.1 Uncharacterised protein [Vibrio cholerae]CSB52743.1 Uncharacterised protein [Vibrio cholerae]CSB71374.1 Uncharacterised protein [Vibrio cholerae]